MRFISFTAAGRKSFGVVVAGGVCDLGARLGTAVPDLKSLLAALALGATAPRATGRDYADGEFIYDPVIPNPDKVICVGLNYEEHRRETGRPEAAYPSIFTRFADTLIGHGAAILRPPVSTALDYEGELAVVIGKPAYRITRAAALDHVAGYTLFNDASLRDWQRHTHQFIPGKNFPASGPLGPALVTPDEAVDGFADRAIVTRLNGAVVQQATLGDMIFPVDEIIAYVSGFTRLNTGDVIATGTPGGVGFKRTPPLYMKAGDTVEVDIAGVGILANPVVDEG